MLERVRKPKERCAAMLRKRLALVPTTLLPTVCVHAPGTRWLKVWRDLVLNKTRTVLVVLSISVGVFAVGTIAYSQNIMTNDLADRYAAIEPASATLNIDKPFDDELVDVVRRVPGIAEAQGRATLAVRMNKIDTETGYAAQITAFDYRDERINKIRLETGSFPPRSHEIALERTSLDFMRLRLGDTVQVETSAGNRRQLEVVATVRDLTIVPPIYSAPVAGYVSLDTLEWLGITRGYNQLLFVVADPRISRNKDEIRLVANKIANTKIKASGRQVVRTDLPISPGEPTLAFVINAMLLVLGALSVLVLLPSSFLVLNTISALLAQQVRQIGIMKALGARTRQVIAMYLAFVALLGLLAVALPLPLSALAARGFSSYMAGILNFDLATYSFPASVVLLELVAGLGIPMVAALYPVFAGTRITVREAISSYGIVDSQTNVKHSKLILMPNLQSLISRSGAQTPRSLRGNLQFHLPRPLLLSMRNTLRRPTRLAFTLLPLVLAGALSISVFSVRASLLLSLDELAQFWKYDIGLDLVESEPVDRLTSIAEGIPGVVRVEGWQIATAVRVRPDGSESDIMSVVAAEAGTKLIQPILVRGRWLLPDDENAVVLSAGILRGESDIRLGDNITLKIDSRKTEWRVVGLTQAGMTTLSYAYVNLPYFARVMRHPSSSNSLRVVTALHDSASELAVMQALESALKHSGIRTKSSEATTELINRITSGMSVMIVFLLILSLLLGLVGGLGLMGTQSLNVLERTREIGVMRAIGASNGAVMTMILVEAICMGLLSCIGAVPLSYPLSRLLSDQVGIQLFQSPLSFSFAPEGILLWVIVVLLLSVGSSYLPARRASRLTVREVLSYE